MSLTPFTVISEEELRQKTIVLLSENKVPGISISIRQGATYNNIALGISKKDKAMDKETYCYGASLTKPLFAFIIHRLHEEKIINTELPIVDQIELDHYDHLPYYTLITPKHVLSHTSGLPNWAWNTPLTQEYPPGTQFQYSGEGYVMLQKAVELLTGKSSWQLLQELLMEPAGLTRIALHREDLIDNNFVEGHDEDGKFIKPPNYEQDQVTKNRINIKYNAAGSIWVEPESYAKAIYYIQMKHTEIWESMQSEKITHDPWKIGWGLGIGYQYSQLGKALWQWGSESTIKDFTITYLDHDIAIHIFTNGAKGKAVYTEILRLLTDEIPKYLIYS